MAELFLEYEELVNHIGPEIEYKYILNFGFLEIKLYELEIEINKLKKKIQIIQKELNHQNKISIHEIDSKLEELFKAYDENLKKQKEDYGKLSESEKQYLSKEDTTRLKEMYRKIVKVLHPDLKTNVSETEKTLFNQATFAFKVGDLETVEMIHSIMELNNKEETLDDTYLKERILKMKEKIIEYKEKYPYNKKQFIEDKRLKKEYLEGLKDLFKTRTKQKKEYEERIRRMIENDPAENRC